MGRETRLVLFRVVMYPTAALVFTLTAACYLFIYVVVPLTVIVLLWRAVF